MEPSDLPRFDAASRRAFLKRAAAIGAVVAVPGVLAACGTSDDGDTFADSSVPVTTATTTAAGAETTTAGGSSSDGEALPEGAALEVAFTYTADGAGFGPARNPFIAVWVEDAAGELVATLSVWYNPPKGERWINNLASWYSAAAGADVDAVTGATRPAGSYTVAWDGTDLDGQRAAQGTYTVFIESAREHGTHSLTSAPIELGTADAQASMDDSGELSAASAAYTA